MANKPLVLIVEDEVIIAWDLQAELEMRGYAVAGPAGSVVEALDLLGTDPVGLAVLDINLGDNTSYDVARRCLGNGVPVVFLSGDAGDARPDELTGIELVMKPVDYAALDAAMARAIGR